MSTMTWKEKMADDMAYVSRFPQFSRLFDKCETCEHKAVLRRYEMINSDTTVCKECGLIDPPKTKGQRTFWSCDCDQENTSGRKDCKRCHTPRGQRIPAIYVGGERRPELIRVFIESLSKTS